MQGVLRVVLVLVPVAKRLLRDSLCASGRQAGCQGLARQLQYHHVTSSCAQADDD